MKVELISHTEHPDELCSIAGQTCYSTDDPGDIIPKISTLENIIESGHDSVLEHAVFTFAVSGISRVCSHQLVRHRMASYSQQSQRYSCVRREYVTPPIIADKSWSNHDEGLESILDSMLYDYWECVENLRDILTELGVPEEDIRYYYPQGITTNIVMTMNARELRHFFALRCCNRAQWEIREMADQMLEICQNVAPTMFKDAGPGCVRGKCPEGAKSCKKVKK